VEGEGQAVIASGKIGQAAQSLPVEGSSLQLEQRSARSLPLDGKPASSIAHLTPVTSQLEATNANLDEVTVRLADRMQEQLSCYKAADRQVLATGLINRPVLKVSFHPGV
jgi:hypothetical protein